MQPPSIHSHFFSSLKQVEKRLKLDIPPPPLGAESSHTPTESLSSPIYLNYDKPTTTTTTSTLQEDSEPPHEFLSNSIDFPPPHKNPPHLSTLQTQETVNEVKPRGVDDDIQLLMQLLGLSDREEEDQKRVGLGLEYGGCDGEFYGKIVGVKGPKCGKEVERLKGWIEHFSNGPGEVGRTEPLRLAHLLLGKFAFVSKGGDEVGEFEFPSTIDEFLQNDPPSD